MARTLDDLNIVKQNIQTMYNQGASPDEIDSYAGTTGFSPDEIKTGNLPEVGVRPPDILDRILPRRFQVPFLLDVPIAEAGGRGRAKFPEGELNTFGEVFTRLPATVRGAIDSMIQVRPREGESTLDYNKRALKERSKIIWDSFRFPERVKTYLEREQGRPIKTIGTMTGNRLNDYLVATEYGVRSMGRPLAAFMADIGTSPADIALMMAGGQSKPVRALARKQFEPLRFAKNQLNKFRLDYVQTKVAPRAMKAFSKNLNKFGADIQKLMIKNGVPKSVINVVKKKGYNTVMKLRDKIDDVSKVYDDFMNGFAKQKAARQLNYENSIGVLKNNHPFHFNSTYRNAKRILQKEYGIIDQMGRRTARAEIATAEQKAILDIFEDITRHMVGKKRSVVGAGNKADFYFYREMLNKGTRFQDPSIQRVLNALHRDAQKSGAKGLIKAKKFYEKSMKAEKQFLNTYGEGKGVVTERRLSKWHRLTQSEKDKLRALEKNLKINVIDDLELLTAADEIGKFNYVTLQKLQNDLQKAINPIYHKSLRTQYQPILGADTMSIFKDVIGHRNRVYGIGGAAVLGIGSTLLRRAIRKGTKGIEEAVGVNVINESNE